MNEYLQALAYPQQLKAEAEKAQLTNQNLAAQAQLHKAQADSSVADLAREKARNDQLAQLDTKFAEIKAKAQQKGPNGEIIEPNEETKKAQEIAYSLERYSIDERFGDHQERADALKGKEKVLADKKNFEKETKALVADSLIDVNSPDELKLALKNIEQKRPVYFQQQMKELSNLGIDPTKYDKRTVDALKKWATMNISADKSAKMKLEQEKFEAERDRKIARDESASRIALNKMGIAREAQTLKYMKEDRQANEVKSVFTDQQGNTVQMLKNGDYRIGDKPARSLDQLTDAERQNLMHLSKPGASPNDKMLNKTTTQVAANEVTYDTAATKIDLQLPYMEQLVKELTADGTLKASTKLNLLFKENISDPRVAKLKAQSSILGDEISKMATAGGGRGNLATQQKYAKIVAMDLTPAELAGVKDTIHVDSITTKYGFKKQLVDAYERAGIKEGPDYARAKAQYDETEKQYKKSVGAVNSIKKAGSAGTYNLNAEDSALLNKYMNK